MISLLSLNFMLTCLLLYMCMCIAEALELISTAANHSNAAIRKMVRIYSTLLSSVFFFFFLLSSLSKLFATPFHCLIELCKETANVLTNQKRSFWHCTVSQQHCKCLSERVNRVELVQTGSCCFLPRVSQLVEDWLTLSDTHPPHLFPLSGHYTCVSHIL